MTAWSAKGRNDGNKWVAAIAVVKGRNETNSRSSRLIRMSPRSVALTKPRHVIVRNPHPADERETHDVAQVPGRSCSSPLTSASFPPARALPDEQRDRDSKHGVGERLEAGDGQQADLRARGLDRRGATRRRATRLRAIDQRIAPSCRVALYEVG